MNRLLALQTSNGREVLYPISILKRTCGTIKDALDSQIAGQITVPFTDSQFDLFLEFLETRSLSKVVEEALVSLEIADYLALRLTQTELHRILSGLDLEGAEQADEFLIEAGFKELSIKAVQYLLIHRIDLVSYKGLSIKERVERFVKTIQAKEQLFVDDIISSFVPVVPLGARHHLTLLLGSRRVKVEIPAHSVPFIKMALSTLQNYLAGILETQGDSAEFRNYATRLAEGAQPVDDIMQALLEAGLGVHQRIDRREWPSRKRFIVINRITAIKLTLEAYELRGQGEMTQGALDRLQEQADVLREQEALDRRRDEAGVLQKELDELREALGRLQEALDGARAQE